MNLSKAEFHLRQIDYKPDHELRWDVLEAEPGHETIEVWWEFNRPDCYDPTEWGIGRSGPIVIYLPHVYGREQLVKMIFSMTLRLEEHEAREFFLYGIQRPFDPHKNLIDRYDK